MSSIEFEDRKTIKLFVARIHNLPARSIGFSQIPKIENISDTSASDIAIVSTDYSELTVRVVGRTNTQRLGHLRRWLGARTDFMREFSRPMRYLHEI